MFDKVKTKKIPIICQPIQNWSKLLKGSMIKDLMRIAYMDYTKTDPTVQVFERLCTTIVIIITIIPVRL